MCDKGYYAIAQDKQEITIYDQSGNDILHEKITYDGHYWEFAQLSDDGEYLMYGDAQTDQIYIYSFSQKIRRKAGNFADNCKTIGCVDGSFYLADPSDGILTQIDRQTLQAQDIIFTDTALSFITPYYLLGTTQSNYIVMKTGTMHEKYTPFSVISEIPMTAGEAGFITSDVKAEDTLLRIYRIKGQNVVNVRIPNRVEKVLYAENEMLYAAAFDDSLGRYMFYIYDIASLEGREIPIYDRDKPNKIDSFALPSDYEGKYDEDSIDSSEEASNRHMIKDVPLIAQMPEYPTGCESVSAVMVMKYWGSDITVDEFIDGHLNKSSDFYLDNGKNYGPDPNEQFVGDPRSRASYGCYAPVIENALNNYYDGDAIVSNTTGTSLQQLCSDYIDNDIPVLIWASISMQEPKYTSMWYLSNGEAFQWLNNEHCMVLTGYDNDYYYFNDPYSGKAVRYEKQLAESRFDAFGKQSIVVEK